MKLQKSKIFLLGFSLAGINLFSCDIFQKTIDRSSNPNVIYILADDLGYGDLSCYGQSRFATPNIDSLASEGMRFTRHYAGSTVCAPSRSVLMTGLHTGHTPSRGNISFEPLGQFPLADSVFTLAELFKESGYITGGFGKWGLGSVYNEGDPQLQGFDHYFGHYCQSLAHRYYPEFIWDDGEKIILNNSDSLRDYSADIIHSKALEFIKRYQGSPFFLYLPYTLPHAEIIVPDDEILASNRNVYLPEKVYKGNDYFTNDFRRSGYSSQNEGHAVFVSMVQRFDKYVGEIISLLRKLDLSENTIILLTSDNGPHQEAGADPYYFNSNAGMRGIKRDLYEGGIRVPLIVKWPGRIPKGSTTDHISTFYDFMPTVADLLNSEKIFQTDGISFLPTLLGNKEQPTHDFLYWEFYEQGGKQAVRMGEWKAVRLQMTSNPNALPELYNLESDPFESNNIAKNHPDILLKCIEIMDREHVRSNDFSFEYER